MRGLELFSNAADKITRALYPTQLSRFMIIATKLLNLIYNYLNNCNFLINEDPLEPFYSFAISNLLLWMSCDSFHMVFGISCHLLLISLYLLKIVNACERLDALSKDPYHFSIFAIIIETLIKKVGCTFDWDETLHIASRY